MWRQKLSRILNVIICLAAAAFACSALYSLWHYTTHPELYMVQSAPWYTNIFINGIFTASIVIFALIIKLIIKKSAKN